MSGASSLRSLLQRADPTESSSLRTLLKRIDLTAPAIQGAAGAMMRHYDRSPGVAVTEWRNALQQARPEQYLPLLYVANEVLQNSKRNRGNKFLEAFSPTLGQSLIFISQRSSKPDVEKIRRTVKIWADRHVLSVRFVNELLKGLEPYRGGNTAAATAAATTTTTTTTTPPTAVTNSPRDSTFFLAAAISAASQPETSQDTMSSKKNVDQDEELEDDTDDTGGGGNVDDDDDFDDIDDLFGNASSKLLNIDVDLDQAAAAASSKKKRRRSDASASFTGITSSSLAASTHKARRRSILSTSSLMELWNQVSSFQMSYDHVQGALKEINTPANLDEEEVHQQIDTLVGDELLNAYRKTIQYETNVASHRRELYDIAQRRKALELEAVRYLPWLENSLKQDEEDIQFCDKYAEQLKLFAYVHKPSMAARDKRLEEEEERRFQQEELRKKREEEEERKKFMESAMSKQTEAKPGMVWNKATGEYQYLNQDESWRD